MNFCLRAYTKTSLLTFFVNQSSKLISLIFIFFKETEWRKMPAISEYFDFVNEVIPGHEYTFVVRPVHGNMRGPESTLTIDIR